MAHVDHWIAFGLLVAIGLHMIREAVHAQPKAPGDIGHARLALLALSTSIAAAAVGVTLVVLQIPIVTAALVIGAITFVMTCVGFMPGGVAAQWLPRYAEIAGGLVLIGIGTKILLEQTLFH